MTSEQRQFLLELLDTPSPTGWELPGQKVWANYLKDHADKIENDPCGNAWARLDGNDKAKHTLMFAAHADEIGFIVRHINKDGFLRIDRVGGSDIATARGRRLRILTRNKGEVRGVIGNTAIHLRKDNAGNEKAPKVQELFVDVGATNPEEVAAMGIQIGNPAVYSDQPEFIGDNLILSRALDNRIGGYIIAEALKRIANQAQRPNVNLVFLNTIQEEIGGNGASIATHRLQPDFAICLDVTHATDTPGIDQNLHGELKFAHGPSVTHGTCNHPKLVQALEQTATVNDIPLQHESSSRFSGTDTDNIFTSGNGVPSALVSLPLRYMHSVVETAHLRDIEQTIELFVHFINSIQPDQRFEHSLDL